MSKTKTLLQEALAYEKRGFSIIPVGQDKKPLIQWLPFQNKRATPEQISLWWKKHPSANIGIVTGAISGISVLDIDPDNGGVTPKGIPPTLTSKTQSGGFHYYFKYEKDLHNMAGVEQGVDIRSDGGYVIAPPSIGKKGTYEWLVEEELAEFPEFLLKKTKTYSKKDWSKISSGASKGDRNMNATQYIGLLLSKFPITDWESVAWPTVVGWNKQNNPPLSQKELRTTFDSICTREHSKKENSVLSPIQINEKQRIKKFLADSFESKNPVNNMASVCLFFENFEQYTHKIKYNTFRRQIEIDGEELTDETILKIMKVVQQVAIPTVKRETVHQAIQNYAFENAYDEALDWLNGLEWDGEKRLEIWLIQATGVEDDKDKYHRSVGAQWFLGLVNRLVHPGCIFDHALVLSGDQGIGKTSLFRIIGGPWYKNYSGSMDNNDFYLLIRGTAILDLDEGATLYKTGAQKVKASISLTFDEFRAPYDRTTQKHPRRFVFSMTTNDAEPLRDTTGNRRYWIVDLKEKINFAWLEENRDQLYAEAYHYIKENTKLIEVPLDVAQEKQELHLSQDSWQTPIQEHFRSNKEYCEGNDEFSTTINEIFSEVIDPEGSLTKLNKQTEMRLATILKVLGFEKKRKSVDGEKRIRWYLSDKKIEEIKENKPEVIPTIMSELENF